MCLTKSYMFLTCLIPGPSRPKEGIYVYLQPLIDDLKRLWIGEWTYDVSRKQKFNMRDALMWTINEFLDMSHCLVGVRMAKWDVHIAWDTQKCLLWKWVGKVCGLSVIVGSYL